MMNRALLAVLLSFVSYSLQGSFFADPQDQADKELVMALKESLLKREGAFERLKRCLGDDVKRIIAAQERIANLRTYGIWTVVQLFRQLDHRLFPHKDQLFQLVLPNFPVAPSRDDRSLDDTVAQAIKLCLSGVLGNDRSALDLVTYMYNNHKISVDAYPYAVDDDDEGSTIGAILTRPYPSLLFAAEIADLVKEKRIDDKALVTLVQGCLFKKKELREVRSFMSRYPQVTPHDLSKIMRGKESLVSWLNKKDPSLYTMKNDLLVALGQPIPVGGRYGRHLETEENHHKHQVAEAIIGCLNGEVDFEEIQFLYGIRPICVDKHMYDGNDTIGQVLDRKSVRNRNIPEFKKLYDLVKGERWATPTTDPQRKQCMKLLVAHLISRNGLVQEKLNYYLACFPQGIILDGVSTGLNGEMNTLGSFVHSLSSSLIPRKDDLIKSLKLKPTTSKLKTSWKSDKLFLENLIRAGLTHQALVPLVEYAYNNYRRVHPSRKMDLFSIHYLPGQTVGSYCKKQGKLPQCREYIRIFTKHTSQKNGPAKSDVELKKRRPSGSSWSGIVYVGALGIVSYFVYGFYKNSKTDLNTRAPQELKEGGIRTPHGSASA